MIKGGEDKMKYVKYKGELYRSVDSNEFKYSFDIRDDGKAIRSVVKSSLEKLEDADEYIRNLSNSQDISPKIKSSIAAINSCKLKLKNAAEAIFAEVQKKK